MLKNHALTKKDEEFRKEMYCQFYDYISSTSELVLAQKGLQYLAEAEEFSPKKSWFRGIHKLLEDVEWYTSLEPFPSYIYPRKLKEFRRLKAVAKQEAEEKAEKQAQQAAEKVREEARKERQALEYRIQREEAGAVYERRYNDDTGRYEYAEVVGPQVNVDGTPMLNGVDIHGRVFGDTTDYNDLGHHAGGGYSWVPDYTPNYNTGISFDVPSYTGFDDNT